MTHNKLDRNATKRNMWSIYIAHTLKKGVNCPSRLIGRTSANQRWIPSADRAPHTGKRGLLSLHPLLLQIVYHTISTRRMLSHLKEMPFSIVIYLTDEFILKITNRSLNIIFKIACIQIFYSLVWPNEE